MNTTDIIRRSVWQNGACRLLARARNVSGQYITQASLSALAYSVYDLANANALVTSAAVTISVAVFDALQADPVLWPQDNIGFNLNVLVPAAAFPVGGRTYRAEVKFTLVSGDPFRVVYELPCKGTLS